MTKVLFFAELKEQLKSPGTTIELTGPKTVAEFRSLLVSSHPEWQSTFAKNQVLCAVNQEMADAEQLIQPGDEVAFFPPVTGG